MYLKQFKMMTYPGTPLRRGSSGDNVKYIQYLLDGIQKQLYPTLKFLKVDGIYGSGSEADVMQYQLLKGLSADGIVGRNTWNAIEKDYLGLTDEKYAIYPGVILSRGSTGIAVEILQRALNELCSVYPSLCTDTPDGKFGEKTERAVRLFQTQFGLSVDEKVGEKTWARIAEVYRAVRLGSPTSVETRYPGLLRLGSRGDNVWIVQAYLNEISAANGNFYPKVTVDGIFGEKSQSLVTAFQCHFELKADGIIGQDTWAEIIKMFNADFS